MYLITGGGTFWVYDLMGKTLQIVVVNGNSSNTGVGAFGMGEGNNFMGERL